MSEAMDNIMKAPTQAINIKGGGQKVIANPTAIYEARRRPVKHSCGCGHRETLIPPCCTQGVMVWTCHVCGTQYKMTFFGVASQAGETVFKGAF